MGGMGSAAMGNAPTPLIDQKFTSAARTPLEVEVTSSLKTFDFVVDRAK
jgi:hypothetical protein